MEINKGTNIPLNEQIAEILEKDILLSQAVTSQVLGSYEIPGDYAMDGKFELRFISPKGIYWDSPPIWYIQSFMFKFSPGLVLGYNGGWTGLYSSKRFKWQHSAYVSPLIAIRINGDLSSVMRFDFAFSSSQIYEYIFSINFSSDINASSIPINRWGQND